MKTKFSFLLIMLIAVGLFNSCTIMGDSIKPSKNNITRDYKVKEFKQVDASTVGDIYYTQSTDGQTSVQIYGPDNIINLIQVSVKGEQLVLAMEKRNNIKNCKLKIRLSSPDLNRINFKGVGDVYIEEPFTTAQLDIESKGVGDVRITNLNCDKLTVSSMGVGDVELRGKVQSANLASKGVGDIKAEELEAVHVDASSKGVGNISCHATESIKASAKGVGGIKYKGNPTQKSLNKAGIGAIENI